MPLAILLIVLPSNAHSQVLETTNLDLSPAGAEVFDVIDCPPENAYIIVGNFTHVNGQLRNKMAFIDKDNLTLLSGLKYELINNIDGDIYTAKLLGQIVGGVGQWKLYIGGDFENINGNLRTGLATFRRGLSTFSSFSLRPFHADFPGGSGYRVNDIENKGDTLIIAGAFLTVDETNGPFNREGFAAWEISGSSNHNLLSYPNDYLTLQNERMGTSIFVDGNDVYVTEGRSFLGGTAGPRLLRWDANGDNDPTFVSGVTDADERYFQIKDYNDTTMAVFYDPAFADACDLAFIDKRNGNDITFDFSSQFTPIYGDAYDMDMVLYKGNHYMAGDDGVSFYEGYTQTGNPATNANYRNNYYLNPWYRNLFRVDNKLFVSGDGLTTIEGQARTGLAIYCLEPYTTEPFDEFEDTVCSGQSFKYGIPPPVGADSYVWEYSGTGLTINNGAEVLDYDSLENIPTVSYDTLWIDIESNFTPGTLTVTPYSECGLPGESVSIQIFGAPLPDANAGLDSTLNCVRTSVDLTGTSSTASVTFAWELSPGVWQSGPNFTATTDDDYVLRVQDPLMCTSYDTVTITMDTIPPTASMSTNTVVLTCSADTVLVTGSSGTPGATMQWTDGGTSYPNPLEVTQDGLYTLEVTHPVNGCVNNDSTLVVTTNGAKPNLNIQGYASIPVLTPLDTITCVKDTIHLIAFSDSVNAVVNWSSADSSTFFGDSIAITQGGLIYLHAEDSLTGCIEWRVISIDQNTLAPDAIVPANSDINCSRDSVLLTGSTSLMNTSLTWDGPTVTGVTNPVMARDQGRYYLTVTNLENGCTAVDSVDVGYVPEIEVAIGSDTTVCDLSPVPYTATYVGPNVTGIGYSWSNGGVNATETFLGGSDSVVVVEVTGDNSCYGTDTAYISIPPTPSDSILTFQPCGTGATGQIVVNLSDGWAPYQYSIDGGTTYQTGNTFNGLTFGTYTIDVLDSLGCLYSYSTVINSASSVPEPDFLVATNSQESDTIVLIDVSQPRGDSVAWTFPAGTIIVDSNEVSPMIILPDTGAFDVTITAWYGGCESSLTKTIYALPFNPNVATPYNDNGIETITLYPNPNTGTFTVEVGFFTLQNAAITVHDVSGNNYFNQFYPNIIDINQSITLPSSAQDGTYVMKVVSEFDSAVITFILAR